MKIVVMVFLIRDGIKMKVDRIDEGKGSIEVKFKFRDKTNKVS